MGNNFCNNVASVNNAADRRRYEIIYYAFRRGDDGHTLEPNANGVRSFLTFSKFGFNVPELGQNFLQGRMVDIQELQAVVAAWQYGAI